MITMKQNFARDKFYSLTDLIAIRRFMRCEAHKYLNWDRGEYKPLLEAIAIRIEEKRRNGETEPIRNQYTPVSEKRRCRANVS
jgi:hypothetical protein